MIGSWHNSSSARRRIREQQEAREKRRGTIAVDFDGVIHRYSRGWQDGSIYDEPVEGALEALRTLMAGGPVFIFTSRSTQQVAEWLASRGFRTSTDVSMFSHDNWTGNSWNTEGVLLVTNTKLSACVYIDDRGLRFTSWGQALTELDGILRGGHLYCKRPETSTGRPGTMSLTQDEAVSLLNQVIYRPGWMISARPLRGSQDQVLLGITIQTVDSSFVTRGGGYTVPLTEHARYVLAASDYSTAEALLFRVFRVITGDLQEHEDREFLRTWSRQEERWVAPFHSHVPEGGSAWDRAGTLPQPAVTRISHVLSDPCMDLKGEVRSEGCEYGDVDPCNQSDDEAEDPRAQAEPCSQNDDDGQTCSEHRVRAVACQGNIDGDDGWCGEGGGPALAGRKLAP